ncbi:MAG: PAS domain S-box protein [Desulfobacteraceae bacterium]|nr:PAS domain S-box protein [Desulfobacteraceae bacterium]
MQSASHSTIERLKQMLKDEQRARKQAENQIRTIAADHKRMEIELIRYQDHFEALVASRTAELMAINEKLIEENRERRLAERERRSFEDQFREASLLLETVLNAIPDIIGVQDAHHRIIRFNKAGYKFFNKKENEVVGKHCYELIGEVRPCELCVTNRLLDTSQPNQMTKYIEEKGIWMDIRAYPILDMDGRVVRIVEHWRDITNLKKSEASLRESEEKYRLLVENANAAIFIFQDGVFKLSNRKALQIGRRINLKEPYNPLISYIHEDDRRDEFKKLEDRLNGHEKKPLTLVFRLKDKHEKTIWVELNTVNITWRGKAATLNLVHDITQSKNLESRFQEAQRMESLGTLAGGIAHDFNNLLMGIQGNVSLMYLNVEPENELYEKLRSIESCVESGSQLTKQLLGFARGGKYVVKPMNMNQIVQSSAEMFGRTRRAIKIHGNYERELWTVMVDRSQIEQVMVNFYLNAWQAMQGNGDLYLKTENAILKQMHVKAHGLPAGRYVRLSVRDTGIGMDTATRRRIFEPFFTTHEPGRGTGLGLASAFGIIKNHNGFITVQSKLGEGSTFEVYLPATDKKPEAETLPAQSVETGTETILLVDDEDYIIEVGQLMLNGLGYSIIPANGGVLAIDKFIENQDKIDLIILDMVMPDLDGEAVFHKLRKLSPGVKVLFASGNYVVEQTRALLKTGNSDFLQKPYNLRQLSTKVRTILDGPQTI